MDKVHFKFLPLYLHRPHIDRISDGVPKKLRRNRNRDSCEKSGKGTENTGIRRIPAGITNLGVVAGVSNGGAKGGRWPSLLLWFGAMLLSGRVRRKPAPPLSIGGGGVGRAAAIPLKMYVGLFVLHAINLRRTNLAMQYVHYLVKMIMKSACVVFMMMFGVIVSRKRYGIANYCIMGIMVAGLTMFFHADANTSAVFNPLGIIMLTISLHPSYATAR